MTSFEDGQLFQPQSDRSLWSPAEAGSMNAIRNNITDRWLLPKHVGIGSAARHTDQYFEDFYDNAPCGFHSLDTNGVFISINQTELDWLGYTKDEVIGTLNFANVITPASREMFARTFPEFLRTGDITELEFAMVRKDGTSFPVLLSASANKDEAGRVVHSRSIVFNISDHKDLQRANARLAAFVKSSPDAMLSMDLNGILTSFNDGAVALFGYSREEMVGQSLYRLIPPTRVAETSKFFEIVSAGGRIAGQLTDRVRKDGTFIRVSVSWSPLFAPDGNVEGVAIVAHDVSESQKQAELLDLTHDAIMVRALDGTIEYWNRGAERMYGFSADEAVGRVSHDLLHTHFPESLESLQKVILDKGIWEGELVHCTKSGRCVIAASRWTLRRDASGRPSGVMEINNDVTERSIYLSEVRRLAAALENSADAIFCESLDGIILDANPAAQDLYGYTKSELVGKPLSLLMDEQQEAQVRAYLKLASHGQRIEQFCAQRRKKDGTTFDAFITLSPVLDPATGKVISVTCNHRDIATSRRIYDLIKANAELQLAREEAEKAAELKSFFIANVSHELRTPLSGIIGMNELLLQSPLDESQRECARTIHDSAAALLSIVNNILDVSSLEAGKTKLERGPFEIAPVVHHCAKLFSENAKEKNLLLEVDTSEVPDGVVYGDSFRLMQVINNLLNNAIKFTDKGSVRLGARVLKETKRSLSIEVSVGDTGIGMSPDDQAKLFLPFSQIEAAPTRRYSGTGLGLAISKRLVELMGGSIKVSSEPGKGTTFTFTSKLSRQGAAAEAPQPGTSAASADALPRFPKAKILVVEDNKTMQKLVTLQLAKMGITPDVAGDGPEGLEKALQKHYDLILMDVHLPGLSGLEVTNKIRAAQQPARTSPVIVAVTAGALPFEVQAALKSGMDDFLAKPVQLDKLAAMLDKWLDQH